MGKIVLWAPRIITVILTIFISILAFNRFVPGATRMENSMVFIIGLLPAVIMILVLALAWFYKLAGGITFVILGVVMTILYQWHRADLSFLSLASPVIVVGILFILSHFYERSASPR